MRLHNILILCLFSQMSELETLEYSGITVAFSQENTITLGTSDTLQCFTPEFVEYIHAVIIAGNIQSIVLTFRPKVFFSCSKPTTTSKTK